MNYIKNKLQNKRIKPTYQRLRVMEYLEQNRNHPTVDMIYAAMVRRIPTISKTTVYNTLKLFVQHDLVTELTITGHEIRYDIKEDGHHHFMCKKCGKIIDVTLNCPYEQGQVDFVQGHKIDETQAYFKGICKNCLQKQKHNKGESK